MEIEIQNCNSIDNAKIFIQESKLNIKYGINGTGKTSIAKAINYAIEDKKNGSEKLKLLTQFKNLENNDFKPKVHGIDSINSIMVFNEDYINSFMFNKDELIKNSFEIFIKDEQYDLKMEKISNLLITIDNVFKNMPELDSLMSDLSKLKDYFGTTATKIISASSVFGKSLSKGGHKLFNIPEELKEYKSYIQHSSNIKWIDWQIKGKEYLDIEDKCPYCVSDMGQTRKEKVLQISKEYDPKIVENLRKLLDTMQNLKEYFTESTYVILEGITKSSSGKLTSEETDFLKKLKDEIDKLSDKLIRIKGMNFKSLKEVGKVVEIINEYKINLSTYVCLNTETTSNKIVPINEALEGVLSVATQLQTEINQQKVGIMKTINSNKNEINEFLEHAGYSYKVDIIEEQGAEITYKLKLIHQDSNIPINDGKNYLSFGERNALSLILFLFDVLKNSPDLIILDDPISSFDKNKKYAIIHKLFRGKRNLKNKTVLLLTHDFEPVTDMIKIKSREFKNNSKAWFLENKKGQLREKEILDSNIKTFVDITKENLTTIDNDIVKLIYLRRIYEINSDKKEVFALLSNLFHKSSIPKDLEGKQLSHEEISIGISEISEHVNFNYDVFFQKVMDDKFMINLYKNSNNNYEKLQLYRIILEDKTINRKLMDDSNNDIIDKFINETFHVETDYIYQLNPRQYEIIPHYIIDICDEYIAKIKNGDFRTRGESSGN